MARAEAALRESAGEPSPAQRASRILHDYELLSSERDRAAFVAVLASRFALSSFANAEYASPSA